MGYHVLIGDALEFIEVIALVAEFAISEAIAAVTGIFPLARIFGKGHETAFAGRGNFF